MCRAPRELNIKRLAFIVLAAASLAACGRNEASNSAKATAPAHTLAPPDTSGPPPALPTWAATLVGQDLASTTATATADACLGNADKVAHRYAGPPLGAQLIGWGWDVAANRRIERVLLTDESLRVIGAGEGGRQRLDVPRAMPKITDDHAGWTGSTQEPAAVVLAFGLLADGRTVCPLGRIAL